MPGLRLFHPSILSLVLSFTPVLTAPEVIHIDAHAQTAPAGAGMLLGTTVKPHNSDRNY
jgi:hypothetical protein